MKGTILFLCILLSSISVGFTQEQRSVMKISMTDERLIQVQIAQRFYPEVARSITVSNIVAGRHRIKVFNGGQRAASRRRPLYEGSFTVDPGTYNEIRIDSRKGTARINSHALSNRNTEEVHYPNDPINKEKYDERRRTDRYPNNRRLSEEDMITLKGSAEDRITDTDKLKLLQSALDKKIVTSNQVRTILGYLNFESSKLEFAKWAYTRVSDKGDYWKLDSEFTFSSTKEEFSDFLKKAD